MGFDGFEKKFLKLYKNQKGLKQTQNLFQALLIFSGFYIIGISMNFPYFTAS